jgi:hypothetical protein
MGATRRLSGRSTCLTKPALTRMRTRSAKRFPRRLQELCGYSVYKGQFGHIDNRDPIELLGRERGKRLVWEATDAKKARAGKP